jgi:hypothetical protein
VLRWEVKKGRYGGWNKRAIGVEELITFLKEAETQTQKHKLLI